MPYSIYLDINSTTFEAKSDGGEGQIKEQNGGTTVGSKTLLLSGEEPPFKALPDWLSRFSVGISYVLIFVIVLLVALVIGVNIYGIVVSNT